MSTLTMIVAGIAGALGLLMAIFGGGRRIGRKDERAKQDRETVDTLKRIEDAKAAARDAADWRDRLRPGK